MISTTLAIHSSKLRQIRRGITQELRLVNNTFGIESIDTRTMICRIANRITVNNFNAYISTVNTAAKTGVILCDLTALKSYVTIVFISNSTTKANVNIIRI